MSSDNKLLLVLMFALPIISAVDFFFKYKKREKLKKQFNQDLLDFKRQQDFRAKNDL